MKLIIAGDRNFTDHGMFRETVSRLYWVVSYYDPSAEKFDVGKFAISELVCGMAPGADTMAYNWAKNESIPIKEFHAEWDKYSLSAGIKRNIQMGDYADELLAFWDGYSKGTKHMIDYMNSLGKPVWVRMYKPLELKLAYPMRKAVAVA